MEERTCVIPYIQREDASLHSISDQFKIARLGIVNKVEFSHHEKPSGRSCRAKVWYLSYYSGRSADDSKLWLTDPVSYEKTGRYWIVRPPSLDASSGTLTRTLTMREDLCALGC